MKFGTYELSALTYPKIFNISLKETEQKQQQKNDDYRKRYTKQSIIVGVISLCLFYAFDPLINSAIDSQLQLKPDGLLTAAWKDTPLPISTCWYLFGVQNPFEFISGARPYMVEHGPFCYYMNRKRRILEWKEQTVIFMERYEFEFNPEPSQNLDTVIQSVNAPILTGVLLAKNILESYYLNFLGPIVYNAVNMALTVSGETLVETFTARQLMEGRKMKLIEYVDVMLKPVRWLGIDVPDFQKGFMGIMNHSFGITTSIPFFELGPYEAYVRSEQGHTVGHIHQFVGRKTYPEFPAPCNRLSGGDGMFFSRPVEAPKLDVFVQHTCRTLPFVRSYSHLHSGTKVVRYSMDKTMFDMSLPENRCNCLKGRELKDCDGWADMGPCALDLPIGFSFPHFYNSPIRQRELENLKPDSNKHVGYLEVEDNLGAPVYASMKLQAVLDVKPIWSVPSLGSLPPVKLPIFWVDVAGGADGIVLSVGLSLVTNFIRFGSYALLFGGLAYSGILYRRGLRGQSEKIQIPNAKTQDIEKQKQ